MKFSENDDHHHHHHHHEPRTKFHLIERVVELVILRAAMQRSFERLAALRIAIVPSYQVAVDSWQL